MRILASIVFVTLLFHCKAQSKFNGDSLFQAFSNGENRDSGNVKFDHCLEILPLRVYDIPPYAYTNAAVGSYYLTGGLYKLYINDVHGIRFGIEVNAESYDHSFSLQTTHNTTKGSKKDHYLRYGYERVIAEGAYTQLCVLGDAIYVSSLANTTLVYHADTYSDAQHPPVKQLTAYDSTTMLNTKIAAGLLQAGLGGRLLVGKWYLSVEMAWGINIFRKSEEYTANAIFTRINYSQGLNAPSYNRTYSDDGRDPTHVAFCATYLRLGIGYKF